MVFDLGSKNGTQYLGSRVVEVEVPLGSSVDFGGSRVSLLPTAVDGEMSVTIGAGVSARSTVTGALVALRALFTKSLNSYAPDVVGSVTVHVRSVTPVPTSVCCNSSAME